MFGMLDYRAHKLFWLVMAPFRVISLLTLWGIVFVAISIALSTAYSPLAQIVIAYVLMELIALLAFGVFLIFEATVSKVFFWLVDVVPSKGEDFDEAREIVKSGLLLWLGKKWRTDIENWTHQDARDLVSPLNWRARWLFGARDKLAKTTV
jgi:hypothetical protein